MKHSNKKVGITNLMRLIQTAGSIKSSNSRSKLQKMVFLVENKFPNTFPDYIWRLTYWGPFSETLAEDVESLIGFGIASDCKCFRCDNGLELITPKKVDIKPFPIKIGKYIREINKEKYETLISDAYGKWNSFIKRRENV
jgi:uncharacterized protein YwgA